MMTHEQSNFRRASVGLLQKRSSPNSQDNYFREAGEVQRLSRVTRVRMVKESLRPKTIQVGRWKEFRHSQATLKSGKDSFAPKESFPLLAFHTSERKPDTVEFSRDFRDSECE